MPRYRSRSRSYSPRRRSRSYSPRRRSRSPPRSRKRYDDEDHHRDCRSHRDRRSSPVSSGLLVRNLPLDARPEELRIPFEKYGPVKDVYLPKNYYTGEPRGFGFVKFRYAEDAAEAKQRMNHKLIGGREIRIVFAEENRKTPLEMRSTSSGSGRHGSSRRGRSRSRSRSPRRRHHSSSRSRSPARNGSRDRGAKDYSPSPRRSRSVSRSRSPQDVKDDRHVERSPSPKQNGRSPLQENKYAPEGSKSPTGNGHSPSRSRSRS